MSKKPLSTNAMLESEDDFTEAYESYGQGIFRFLFWRTKDTELSEDLTSSVFEKAWRSRQHFQGGSVRAWLYKIARNTLTDHWRMKRAVQVEDMDLMGEVNDNTADSLDLELELQQMQRAIGKLPKSMQEVVQLRFIEGLSAREVGDRLGINEGNVRIIQYRALQRIRKELS